MTKDEAVRVMTDVATRRAPHNRAVVKEALAVLEPPAPAAETVWADNEPKAQPEKTPSYDMHKEAPAAPKKQKSTPAPEPVSGD